MSLPAPLAEVVSDFAEVQGQDKLKLLLEFADELPPLPAELEEAAMEPVPECQSPLFMHVDASDPQRVRLHFSAPAEAPTTRGFASILAAASTNNPRPTFWPSRRISTTSWAWRLWSARCGCAGWRPCWPVSNTDSASRMGTGWSAAEPRLNSP
ncbi:fe-S metabolism associated domain protein [Mycobacterium xenopi 4042]|uniref:Fe-S metabolism associated domain protein n=1 Tax=Mycobacterium xenopi 4042 TaxID=1299334 RepID=X7YHW7_MYCXE|nr:fe-S metabolism associated domain protein [Mycobacterium xenopi 4042]